MYATVKTALAALRAEPCKEAERVDEVLQGWRLRLLARQGDFYHVDTAYGYKGYIHHDDIEKDVAQLKNSRRIAVNFADVLAAPKVQANELMTLPRGAVVGYAGESGIYAHVSLADGQKGYVRKDFLEETTPTTMDENSLRGQLVENALHYLGTQYRWGGKTALGIDCSGLTFMAYHLCGVDIWRDAYPKEGYPIGKISLAKAEVGDLLYFPGHVAMLMGDGNIIHSSDATNGVAIQAINRVSEMMEKLLFCGTFFNQKLP